MSGYLRLDAMLPHQKPLLEAGSRGAELLGWHAAGHAYAERHATDGVIPAHGLPMLLPGQGRPTPAALARLQAAGLWEPLEDGAWRLVDYLDLNKPAAMRTERQRLAARLRWAPPGPGTEKPGIAKPGTGQPGTEMPGSRNAYDASDSDPSPTPTPTPTPACSDGRFTPSDRNGGQEGNGAGPGVPAIIEGLKSGRGLIDPQRRATALASRTPGEQRWIAAEVSGRPNIPRAVDELLVKFAGEKMPELAAAPAP